MGFNCEKIACHMRDMTIEPMAKVVSESAKSRESVSARSAQESSVELKSHGSCTTDKENKVAAETIQPSFVSPPSELDGLFSLSASFDKEVGLGQEYDTLFKDEELGQLFEDFNKFDDIFPDSTDGLNAV